MDALKGLPFSTDYDTWDSSYQRNYERGRIYVVAMRAEGFNPPVWKRSAKLSSAFTNASPAVLHSVKDAIAIFYKDVRN